MFQLDNKVAIITGAARGIGRATARTLAAQGAVVALVDINLEEVTLVADEIGSQAHIYHTDVSDIAQIHQFVDNVEKDLDHIDILVNNAGICPRLPFVDSTEANWEKLVSINAKSQYFMMQAVCPVMQKQGGGRIINLASTGGRVGAFSDASIYSGTKGAIVMFSKSVAREVSSDNILINCVAPGCIDTDMIGNLPEIKQQALCAQIPLRRLGKPEEVAALVAFLASDECSYCTGATFDINGGWVMI